MPPESKPARKRESKNTIRNKIQNDIEKIQSNYGWDLTLNDSEASPLPQIHLNCHREGDIPDEIVTVIVTHGYETAYVNFKKKRVAFSPRNVYNSIPAKIHSAVSEYLTTNGLTPDNSDRVAYKLPTGYEIQTGFIGRALIETLTENEQYTYQDGSVIITFEGLQNGNLILTVTN